MITRRTPRITLAAIITLAAVVLTGIGSGTAAQALTTSEIQAIAPSSYETQLHSLINRERAKRGLRKLQIEGCTDGFATRWTQHLVDTSSFYHQPIRPILDQCHARYASEMIGWGTSAPRTMVTAWMKSSGHRRLLLSSKPRRIGVGAILNSQGQWIVTVNFTRF